MSTAQFLLYLLEHETTRDLGRVLGRVVGMPVDRAAGAETVITLPR